jgi:prepilin-type N-terminal cleavage/methylation domain-containing protein
MEFSTCVRRRTLSQTGFGLIEVLMAVAIMSILGLGIASMMSNQAQMNAVLASQNSNMALGAAIRSQLARRDSCIKSLSQPKFPDGGPVAVRLGPNDANQVVQTGASLPAWKTNVRALDLENVKQFGTTTSGNPVYLGDIMLESLSSDLKPGMRVQMKRFVAARLTFEVQGGAMIACYAGDAYSDTVQQLEQVCRMIASPDRTPGEWINGTCVVKDQRPEIACAGQGGSWNGSGCNMNPVIPAGELCAKLGGSWGEQGCQLAPTQVTTIIQHVASGGPAQSEGSGGGSGGNGNNGNAGPNGGGGGGNNASCGDAPHGSRRDVGCNYERCISGVWILAGANSNCSTSDQGGGH